MYDECMRNGGRGYELQNLPGPVEVILGGVKGSQVGLLLCRVDAKEFE